MSTPLWLALAAVVVVLLVSRLKGGRTVPKNVVAERIAAGAIIVDVRSPEEFRGGAYPGAVNIPIQSFQQRIAEIPKGKPVVLYCASGMRSAMAAAMLVRAGHADVVNAGGLGQMPR